MSAYDYWSDLAEAEELADRDLFPAAFVVPPTKDARGISVLCGLDSPGQKPAKRAYVNRRKVRKTKKAELRKRSEALNARTLTVSAQLTGAMYSVGVTHEHQDQQTAIGASIGPIESSASNTESGA